MLLLLFSWDFPSQSESQLLVPRNCFHWLSHKTSHHAVFFRVPFCPIHYSKVHLHSVLNEMHTPLRMAYHAGRNPRSQLTIPSFFPRAISVIASALRVVKREKVNGMSRLRHFGYRSGKCCVRKLIQWSAVVVCCLDWFI